MLTFQQYQQLLESKSWHSTRTPLVKNEPWKRRAARGAAILATLAGMYHLGKPPAEPPVTIGKETSVRTVTPMSPKIRQQEFDRIRGMTPEQREKKRKERELLGGIKEVE